MVRKNDLSNIEQLGLMVRDDVTEAIDCASTLLLRFINEFLVFKKRKLT